MSRTHAQNSHGDRQRARSERRLLAVALACVCWTSGARAHQFDRGTLDVHLQSGGTACGDISIDAARIPASSEHVKLAVERALELRFDGVPVALEVSRVELGDRSVGGAAGMHRAHFCGAFPAQAQRFVVRSHPPLGVLHVAVAADRKPAVSLLLLEGEASPAFAFTVAQRHADDALGQYARLGFRHILPLGTDHIAFVIGLLLVTRSLRELIRRITAFTIGHSLTLLVAAQCLVTPAATWVEPAIALSVVWIALAALRSREGLSHGAWLVAGVGMVHGLGFASVLSSVGLPGGQLATSLLGFNLGVEAGQLTIVLCVWPALHWAQDHDWFRGRVIVPAATLLATAGGWWLIDRALAAMHV